MKDLKSERFKVSVTFGGLKVHQQTFSRGLLFSITWDLVIASSEMKHWCIQQTSRLTSLLKVSHSIVSTSPTCVIYSKEHIGLFIIRHNHSNNCKFLHTVINVASCGRIGDWRGVYLYRSLRTVTSFTTPKQHDCNDNLTDKSLPVTTVSPLTYFSIYTLQWETPITENNFSAPHRFERTVLTLYVRYVQYIFFGYQNFASWLWFSSNSIWQHHAKVPKDWTLEILKRATACHQIQRCS